MSLFYRIISPFLTRKLLFADLSVFLGCLGVRMSGFMEIDFVDALDGSISGICTEANRKDDVRAHARRVMSENDTLESSTAWLYRERRRP
ncbi:MAG: hypothetical protein KAU10_04330 [Dehalococcoidia bacterium]|nr:hypothetical protein [Dehalococcoidia bacterium]